jgi:hypothetical protein
VPKALRAAKKPVGNWRRQPEPKGAVKRKGTYYISHEHHRLLRDLRRGCEQRSIRKGHTDILSLCAVELRASKQQHFLAAASLAIAAVEAVQTIPSPYKLLPFIRPEEREYQEIVNGAKTLSPFLKPFTSAPTDMTSPVNSWPMTKPVSLGWWPRYTCNSLPHRAVRETLTIASVGCCSVGMGRSSTATFLGPWKTTAFIVFCSIKLVLLLVMGDTG